MTEPGAMDTARVIQVIETTLTRRGRGVAGDELRVVTQYWALDGKLLAEHDPIVRVVDKSAHEAEPARHMPEPISTRTAYVGERWCYGCQKTVRTYTITEADRTHRESPAYLPAGTVCCVPWGHVVPHEDTVGREKLARAVEALYYAAYWHADRPVDERALWEAVRDAAGLEPGQTSARLGKDEDGRAGAVDKSAHEAARMLFGLRRGVEELRRATLSLADLLDGAPRMGAETDEPEGRRWVQLSDTLARHWSEKLRGAAAGHHLEGTGHSQ